MVENKTFTRGKFVGARVPRVEDDRFLTGSARFIADVKVAGMKHVAFVRSPYAHARVVSVDVSQALALAGVAAVVTGEDLADVGRLVDAMQIEGLSKTPQPVLAVDRVRFVGEAVAAVVAEDRYVAEDAADLVVVEYEPLGAVTDAVAGMAADAPVLFEELGTNVLYRRSRAHGDTDSAFAAADRVFEGRFHTNRFMAAPMETRGAIATFETGPDRLHIQTSSQTPHLLRMALAGVLGMPEQRIRVSTPAVGGGFGQKIATSPEEVVVAALARRLGCPVKWVEDRRENLIAGSHAKEQIISLELAVTGEGRILGMRAQLIGDGGGYSFNTSSILVEPQVAAQSMPGVYDIANYDYEVIGVVTNKTPVASFRGIGWTAGHSARELLFDEVARDLGLDPAEFRRLNMIAPGSFPHRTCTDMLYDSGSYTESLADALEMVDYRALRERQRELRAQGRYIGIGISPYNELTGFGTDSASQAGFPFPSHDNAMVTVEPTGKVTVAVGFHSHGQGHETTFAQVAADGLGVAIEDVAVVFGDTSTSPFGMGTYASRSAIIGGGTVSLAAARVREKVLAAAGRLLEVSPEDLEIVDGRVSVAGDPDAGVSFAEVAGAAYFDPRVRGEGEDVYLSATMFYDPPATYSNGTIIAVVEVDPETTEITIERIVASEDCGTVINPMIVEGQVHGAIAQGIGGALLEHLAYDEQGQPLATTYMDYLIPTTMEVPRIDVNHLESPSPFSIGGIKGIGEGGLISAPAAVTCAVLDALAPWEPRLRTLPVTPDRIAEICRQE
ncbi:xanthine dehydrogenase family protein molybdopterin-binding subunit [Capillimicrobium parvum]|uniref:Caffeine dehydrogenase subunit alpha n=1 Tax=Capillimicrobium parvum TaxID=2884022 RepID=A0A9E7C0U4_9ACTN|nr:xanthine dehydrogenase family protein molybdopterin-binding subunit [Capillimicrobium parvum]UGS35984.1 Caffeine dehydrogenase subunit alpha [Capillimicrobium parvum]